MPSARLEHGDVRVGVNTDLGGDLETLAHDLARRELGVLEERASRGHRVRAARSDREDAIVGLDDVAGSGNYEPVLTIGDGEQSVEPAQNAVAAPILRQLHR